MDEWRSGERREEGMVGVGYERDSNQKQKQVLHVLDIDYNYSRLDYVLSLLGRCFYLSLDAAQRNATHAPILCNSANSCKR
jgi:hypothetical protein